MSDFPHISGRAEPGPIAKWLGKIWAKPVMSLAMLALRLNPTVSVIANAVAQSGVSVFCPTGSRVYMANVDFRHDLAPALEDQGKRIVELQHMLHAERILRHAAEAEVDA